MDRFAELQTYVAVVEAGSFSAAARRLGIAVSAVSRRMDELEDRLGVRLANRSTRGFAPTPLGLDYYNSSVRLLADLAEADLNARGDDGALAGRVRIAAPISFGVPYLAPLLTRIAKGSPNLVLDLDVNDRRVDLIGEGFDLAVRIGELKDSSLIARKLFDVRQVVCASPAYWKAHGKPAHPDQLKDHDILAYRGSDVRLIWKYRDPHGVEGSIGVTPRVVCNNGEVLVQAAKEGLGIVMEPSFICGNALANSSLEPCLQDFSFFDMATYAVFAPGRPLPARVRYIIDRIIDEFKPPLPWDAWDNARRN